METTINGTKVRNTPAGFIATRGDRELHFLGHSEDKAIKLLTAYSFDRLFKAASRAPRFVSSKVRYLRVAG